MADTPTQRIRKSSSETVNPMKRAEIEKLSATDLRGHCMCKETYRVREIDKSQTEEGSIGYYRTRYPQIVGVRAARCRASDLCGKQSDTARPSHKVDVVDDSLPLSRRHWRTRRYTVRQAWTGWQGSRQGMHLPRGVSYFSPGELAGASVPVFASDSTLCAPV